MPLRGATLVAVAVDTDAIRRHVAAALRQARSMHGLTQEQLAAQAGITRTAIVNLEKGRQGLSLEVLYRLCAALNLKVDELLPPLAAVISSNPSTGGDLTVCGRRLASEVDRELLEQLSKEFQRRAREER